MRAQTAAQRNEKGTPDARGGDDAAGFEIRLDASTRVVRFDFWGFWGLELGAAFRDAAIEAMRAASSQGPFFVLANLGDYPPQKPEVQACHQEAMVAAHRFGLVRAANLVSSAMSQLQIQRLSVESGLPAFSFFRDEAQALRWLVAPPAR